MKDSIGIIGLGFVGNAIAKTMEWKNNLVIIDPLKGFLSTYEDIKRTDAVFVCVPSPADINGKCDTSILENVLEELKKIEYSGVIISKSTAPPDIYSKLNNLYPNLVHSPEFLTAANAEKDYELGKFAIIGGKVAVYRREAERVIRHSQVYLETIEHCSIEEAALVKYTINSFLATKVVFMNEIYEIANAAGINYNKVKDLLRVDPRVGYSHLDVPGPDESLGFGGMCFPKDTAALLKYAENNNINLNVLNAVVKKNTVLRLQEPK